MTNQATNIKSLVQCGAVDNLGYEVTRGMKGLIVSIMDKMLGGKDNRYHVLAWLFDYGKPKMSSKELTDDQWRGLISWISPAKDGDTGEWMTSAGLKGEMDDLMRMVVAVNVADKMGLTKPAINSVIKSITDLSPADSETFRNKGTAYTTVHDRNKTPLIVIFPEEENPF